MWNGPVPWWVVARVGEKANEGADAFGCGCVGLIGYLLGVVVLFAIVPWLGAIAALPLVIGVVALILGARSPGGPR